MGKVIVIFHQNKGHTVFYKDFFILRITGRNELPVFAKNHEAQKLL